MMTPFSFTRPSESMTTLLWREPMLAPSRKTTRKPLTVNSFPATTIVTSPQRIVPAPIAMISVAQGLYSLRRTRKPESNSISLNGSACGYGRYKSQFRSSSSTSVCGLYPHRVSPARASWAAVRIGSPMAINKRSARAATLAFISAFQAQEAGLRRAWRQTTSTTTQLTTAYQARNT